MEMKNKYGLDFINQKNSDGSTTKICKRNVLDKESELQIISRLDSFETNSLISVLDNAIKGKYYDFYFCTDSIDDSIIYITKLSVIINDIFEIPIQDMKDLLGEWILFLQSWYKLRINIL